MLEKKASPPKASTSAKKRHSNNSSGGTGSGAGHADERPLARRLSFSIVDLTAPRARSFFNGESSPGLVMQNILYVSFAVSVLLMSQKNVARSLFQRRQQEISGVEKVREYTTWRDEYHTHTHTHTHSLRDIAYVLPSIL